MKLIVISAPESIEDEHLILNTLFSKGLEILHLRKPDWTSNEMLSLLENIDKQYHNRIVIHSNYELLNKFKIKGVHFTNKTKHLIGKYSNIKIHKSISCHSLNEIEKYYGLVDYIFISPIFDSISKKGYKANICLNDLERYCNSLKMNIIALGGISNQNINNLRYIKLFGAAVLGDIWQNRNLKDIIQAFEKIKKALS